MSAIDSLQNYCEEKSLKDITLWKRGNSSDSSNGTLEPPEEIANLLCPNQCSGNGKCKNATCSCNTGFETSDCSLRTGATPVINSMQIAKTCDVRKRDCTRVRLSGTNFLESVKCRSTAIEVLNASSRLWYLYLLLVLKSTTSYGVNRSLDTNQLTLTP